MPGLLKLTGFFEFGKDETTLPPRGYDGSLSILLNEGCDWLLTGEDKISVTSDRVRRASEIAEATECAGDVNVRNLSLNRERFRAIAAIRPNELKKEDNEEGIMRTETAIRTRITKLLEILLDRGEWSRGRNVNNSDAVLRTQEQQRHGSGLQDSTGLCTS
ncbi:hypothetical protein ANN_24576 [Periplaneta americana]|uniref:Uncharacterized protein n=1 Tax=Periplaneta americana TaxID=6978 RepID=A0ABQ8S3F4_PERAM|nr:hypothetical protein ANN_24576 [Periplaneta americana]